MLDYVLIIALFGLCILIGAWNEYANRNFRDSQLMTGIGVCAWLASAAVFWATT